MKKNFNEILQREDYVRLTANLKERTEEIAQLIKSKMVQLDLEDETIEVEGVKIAIKGVSSNCGRYEFLAIENTGEFSSEYGEKDWWSLQDVNHTFYYAGDFMVHAGRPCGSRHSRSPSRQVLQRHRPRQPTDKRRSHHTRREKPTLKTL